MNRYKNGKIYKIVDVGYNKCYIGSTCEELSQRMVRHRHQYNSYLKGLYKKTRSFELFDEFGVENCKIELIESYPSDSKEQLRKREGFQIQCNECVNKYIAGRTSQEWREENKDKKAQSDRNYRENNKDKIKHKREERREHYQEYNRNWKSNNKEHVSEYNKRWNEENKEKRAEKSICQLCGSVVRKYDMNRHMKTEKCKQQQALEKLLKGKTT